MNILLIAFIDVHYVMEAWTHWIVWAIAKNNIQVRFFSIKFYFFLKLYFLGWVIDRWLKEIFLLICFLTRSLQLWRRREHISIYRMKRGAYEMRARLKAIRRFPIWVKSRKRRLEERVEHNPPLTIQLLLSVFSRCSKSIIQ